MENEQDAFEEAGETGGLPQTDLFKSYLAFATRALRQRRWVAVLVFLPLAALTFVVVAVWPRTYHCDSRLMAQRTQVLEGQENTSVAAMRAAPDVILRRENLLSLAKQTDLVKNWELSRPATLKMRDRVMDFIHGGHPSEEDIQNGLVSFLETRLSASSTDTTLTISADWQDPQMAARIVEAAQEIFLESRHVAEISTIQEKITILDGHAAKLRQEIDTMAEQLQRIREDRLAEAGKAAKDLETTVGSTTTPGVAAPRRVLRLPNEPDTELPRLKEELETKKHALEELESDRKRRLFEARGKLSELQPKFTAAHPTVLLAEQYVESLSHKSEQAKALEGDIQNLTVEIKQHSEGVKSEGTPTFVGGSAAAPSNAGAAVPGSDLLPSKVMKLLDSGVGVDPAVNAQLQSAITTYASLRDSIRSARIDLDTAQAAFNHRYKVVQPPEAPSRPSKPKVPLLLAGGLIASLFLALAIPVLAELRSGIMVERWQVNQIRLPILAELPFPGRSSGTSGGSGRRGPDGQ